MTTKNTGGPAFPRPAGDYNGTDHGNRAQKGMSLRDYFAAKAMQGYISADWFSDARNFDLAVSQLANESYLVADAMLAAREINP